MSALGTNSPIIKGSPSDLDTGSAAGSKDMAKFGAAFAGLISLEGMAVQFGMLPVKLARETCSVEAENLIRRLGRNPRSENPWLPISTLGPLPIFAHHEPKSEDMWGVPSCLAVRVVISEEQYEKIRRDLVMRLSNTPLPSEGTLNHMVAPTLSSNDLEAAFHWLLENYPYTDEEKERFSMLYAETVDKHGYADQEGFNAITPSLGVALQYLTNGPSMLCFNPEEVPKQDIVSHGMLEKHEVYPVFAGEHRVYLLSTSEDNFALEDE